MPETIKASEQNLDKVFCDEYLFEIPFYQRPYAWTTDEVGDLLEDLLFAMKRGDGAPYFLGSIVLVKGDGADSKVIDGQQRLTTLTILLCTLRDLARGDVRTALDARVRQRPDPLAGTQEVMRLSLRPRDQDFFRANVQQDGAIPGMLNAPPRGATDSQQRIFENARCLHERLSTWDEDYRRTLSEFIIQRCYLVIVSTRDTSSAYRIFSVMNDRGLNLPPPDILKAEIVGAIDETDQREYSEKWENIEQELGRSQFADLFAHIRMVYAKAKARRNLQDEFRDFVLKNCTGTNFVDQILEPYADAYERVLGMSNEDGTGDHSIGARLRHLSRLDNYDWIPPAIAFFRTYPNDPGELARFITDLERLAYGLFIRRANINERIGRYVDILQAMESGHDVWRADSPLQLRTDEKREIVSALDGPIYTLPRVPKPLLLRLDGLLAGAGARYDHPVISIEHVLPQNPRRHSRWLRWFPDDDERLNWTHRLANMALLSRRKNSSASNLEFETKKTEYFLHGGVSPFALTTQVANESEWTPSVLERRQRRLVAAFKREWRLE